MMFAKISTARSFLLGPILDTNGAAKTDEVVASVKVTKNGSVGAPNGSSTLTHNHTGHYVYAAVDGGDFDTAGEVEFSLNSGTNAMAPVKFQVLPAVNFDALFATAPGAATGLFIAGSNAATTLETLTVTGATTLTGNVAAAAGITVTQSTPNEHGIVCTGNGAGSGLRCIGGASGHGIRTTAAGTGCYGISAYASGLLGSGIYAYASGTSGIGIVGSGTSIGFYGYSDAGIGLSVTTMDVVGALTCASFGVDGALSVGTTTTLTGAVSAPAGIAANITGNLVGTVSTVTTLTGHTAQTGDTYALAAGATGFAAIDTVVDAILVDTAELQTDWHDGGRLDLILDAAGAAGDPWITLLPGAYTAGMAGKIIGDNINAPIATVDTVVDSLATELAKVPKSDSTVSWNATALAAIQSECNDALVAYDPPTNAEMEARTLVAANYATAANQTTILGYVDCLPAAWVTVSTAAEIKSALEAAGGHLALALEDTGITLPATLATIAGYLDAEIAAILEDTGTTIPGLIAGLNNLSAAQVNAEVVDVITVDATVDGKTLAVGVAISAAGVLGKLSGAGTGTETVLGVDGVTSRAVVTVDASGNRTAVTY